MAIGNRQLTDYERAIMRVIPIAVRAADEAVKDMAGKRSGENGAEWNRVYHFTMDTRCEELGIRKHRPDQWDKK